VSIIHLADLLKIIAIFPPMTTTSNSLYYACIKNSMIAHARIARLGKSKNSEWQFSIPHIMEWVEPASPTSLLESQTGLIYDPCVFGTVSVVYGG
jgi:beta-glucosidase/6-phospho-beta-glucosidase/beta-galactosidase